MTNAARIRAIADATRTRELARAAFEAADRTLRCLLAEGEVPPLGEAATVGTAAALRLVKTSRRSLQRDAEAGRVAAERVNGRWQYSRASLRARYPSH